MTENRIWEKRPEETSKAYRAFQIYLTLPVEGDINTRRSLENVARKLQLKSITSPAKWSTTFEWVDRAAAYDAYVGTRELVIREDTIETYRQHVAISLSMQLAVLDDILNRQIEKAREGIIDIGDVGKLIAAVKAKDDLARRLAGLPTNFITEQGKELDDETVYVVGQKGS